MAQSNALYAASGVKNSLAEMRKRPKNALVDALRGGLLGATTDAIGYIPDAVADFMRPFGYNVAPQDVIGGTEWLANRFAKPTNSLAEKSARFATGMLTPSVMDFARLGKGPMSEMTVYHGSPHDFDKFDMSKIGTGEGAQAYGHGLYVAESPGVAKSYATMYYKPQDWRAMVVDGKHAAKSKLTGESSPLFDDATGLEKWLKTKQGHVYDVDLPDTDIANMLDWDAPLSQQPRAKGIVSYINKRAREQGRGNIASVNDTGEQTYRMLTSMMSSDARASEKLAELGIPGIKYLDGGSRAAGDGTRNYVVFDDKLLKILKKE